MKRDKNQTYVLETIGCGVILINMIFFVLFFMFAPFSAFAYLDPGTASMIVHAIVWGIVGIAYGIRVFWALIRIFTGRLFRRGPFNESEKEERR